MNAIDEAADANSRFWEQEVEKGGGHTIPWIDLEIDQLRRYIRGELGEERLLGRNDPRRYVNINSGDIAALGNIEDKALLCLSCGGGQQSAVFSLLGAQVTVVDIAEGQLAGDRKAAEHFGYRVRTLHTDARDLSAIEPGSIDIVWGMTPCYVPRIQDVYAQVSSVLKPEGIYRTDVTNPAIFSICWDGGGYRITQPYHEAVNHRADGAVEYRHYMDDIFNGFSETGLQLTRVEDHGRHTKPPADSEPGSYRHEGPWVGGGLTLFARKLED